MIRHIVAWNFKEEFSREENSQNAQEAKEKLEALKDCVPHVISIQVRINLESTSTRAVVMESLFANKEELANYQIHPKHKEVGAFIGFAFTDRVCLDFEE